LFPRSIDFHGQLGYASTYTTFADSTIIGSKYLGSNVVSINVKATLRRVRTDPDK